MLLQTILRVERDEKPTIGVVANDADSFRGPASLDAVGPSEDQESIWINGDIKRRAECPWEANL